MQPCDGRIGALVREKIAWMAIKTTLDRATAGPPEPLFCAVSSQRPQLQALRCPRSAPIFIANLDSFLAIQEIFA